MYTSNFQTWRRDVNLQPTQKTFSSSILDSIYRTIDDNDEDTEIIHRRRRPVPLNPIREDPTTFRRSAVAEKWLQRYQIRPPPPPPSSSQSDYSRQGFRHAVQEEKKKNSDQIPGQKNQKHNKDRQKDKYLKQSFETGEALRRTKSKTMKVYDQLKKAKYPISPGRRISSFLNSLFHSTTPRPMAPAQVRIQQAQVQQAQVQQVQAAMGVGLSIKTRSTCTSVNVPRPCLCKTPGGGGEKVKKSVKFSAAAPCVGKKEEEEEEEDSEDAYSCGSSDLFELENLVGVGGRRYREELPTTTSAFLG